jgi:hypothetical protein
LSKDNCRQPIVRTVQLVDRFHDQRPLDRAADREVLDVLDQRIEFRIGQQVKRRHRSAGHAADQQRPQIFVGGRSHRPGSRLVFENAATEIAGIRVQERAGWTNAVSADPVADGAVLAVDPEIRPVLLAAHRPRRHVQPVEIQQLVHPDIVQLRNPRVVGSPEPERQDVRDVLSLRRRQVHTRNILLHLQVHAVGSELVLRRTAAGGEQQDRRQPR